MRSCARSWPRPSGAVSGTSPRRPRASERRASRTSSATTVPPCGRSRVRCPSGRTARRCAAPSSTRGWSSAPAAPGRAARWMTRSGNSTTTRPRPRSLSRRSRLSRSSCRLSRRPSGARCSRSRSRPRSTSPSAARSSSDTSSASSTPCIGVQTAAIGSRSSTGRPGGRRLQLPSGRSGCCSSPSTAWPTTSGTASRSTRSTSRSTTSATTW